MHHKLSLETRQFEKNDNLELENVATITFSNMTNAPAFLKYNGIKKELPPAQLVGTTYVPLAYSVPSSACGFFDIKFEISFPAKNGKVIVDYLQQKNC